MQVKKHEYAQNWARAKTEKVRLYRSSATLVALRLLLCLNHGLHDVESLLQ